MDKTKISSELLIDLLALPASDERIKKLLQLVNRSAPQANLANEYCPYAGGLDLSDEYGFSMTFFDEVYFNDEPYGDYGDGDMYLVKVYFFPNYDGVLPFNLSFTDRYEDIVRKLGKKEDKAYFLGTKAWLVERTDQLPFKVVITFDEEDLTFEAIKYACFPNKPMTREELVNYIV